MAGGRDGLKKVQAKRMSACASGSTAATTFDGELLTVSDFISRLDETTRRRVENMNQKMRDLEMQMEALETEMTRASECC